MHSITIISTHHAEIQKCNSDELYKIIDSINPDVIFEELPSISFDNIYNNNRSDISIEAKSIKKYLQNHEIEHIPVDTIADPNRSSIERLMFEKFERYPEYKRIKYEHNSLIAREGFNYLNSNKCIDLVEKWILIEKAIVKSDEYKDLYLQPYNSFYEDVNSREKVMLQNIYNYSKQSQYNQAIFLLGCGHRKSIISKIVEHENQSDIKLNWTVYGTN